MKTERLDLRRAVNAISDVIQNRPLPIREFDQIYMKAGDMVMQSEYIARRFDGKDLIFIGDGDSISLCIAYMQHRELFSYGPRRIQLVDFDERIVRAVERFADQERLSDRITARLYNCIDALPTDLMGQFDAFYTNPPWGASNDGESVKVFAERGIEALRSEGEGVIVIADDPKVDWSRRVLKEVQAFTNSMGFYVQEMQSQVHLYHLDDAPDLRSCNLFIRSEPERVPVPKSYRLHGQRLEHFYGKEKRMYVQYVREKARVDYGKAPSGTYEFEHLEQE
jgi:N4-bis(aminopropyl)spermidine synthase